MTEVLKFFRKVWKDGLGFQLDELMIGSHRFEPDFGPPEDHPMEFHVTWGPKHIRPWLNPYSKDFLHQDLEGHVTIGGLCDSVPCKGTLELNYFGEHRIRYVFDFQVDGKEYQYVGEKVNIQPWNLPVSHTTCYGVVTEKESGRLVSKSVLFFRLSTALSFLTSFRLT